MFGLGHIRVLVPVQYSEADMDLRTLALPSLRPFYSVRSDLASCCSS